MSTKWTNISLKFLQSIFFLNYKFNNAVRKYPKMLGYAEFETHQYSFYSLSIVKVLDKKNSPLI